MNYSELEALAERRPPWLRQIITPILSTVKMLSLAGERLTLKVLDHYLHQDQVMLPLLWWFFAHLLILEYLDHHQNLISFSLYYLALSIKFHPNPFITFWVMLSTNKQTNRQINATKNMIFFAKEVKMCFGGLKWSSLNTFSLRIGSTVIRYQ